jgi:hypothetical protein
MVNIFNDLPFLSREEENLLLGLKNQYYQAFQTNQLSFFLKTLTEYIQKRQVFRVSVMGQTRVGKSEIGSTICFWGTNIYNKLLNKGIFDDWDLLEKKKFSKTPNTFDTSYVCANQMDYNDSLRKKLNNNELKLQQFWQIDEEKNSIGGVGSISEMIETANLNNIIAKVCQHEIWIRPLGFQARNTVFGLHAFKKDMKNFVNWCLVYQVGSEPSGATTYNFIGWAGFPLHKNEKFRIQYNDKKDDWIVGEMKGKTDPRMESRSQASEYLCENYPKFFELNDSGRFIMTKGEQLVLLNRIIMKNEIRNYNETEKYMILEEARLIAKEKNMGGEIA